MSNTCVHGISITMTCQMCEIKRMNLEGPQPQGFYPENERIDEPFEETHHGLPDEPLEESPMIEEVMQLRNRVETMSGGELKQVALNYVGDLEYSLTLGWKSGFPNSQSKIRPPEQHSFASAIACCDTIVSASIAIEEAYELWIDNKVKSSRLIDFCNPAFLMLASFITGVVITAIAMMVAL